MTCVAHLTGFQVLRAQGLESESPLAFAGLHQLLVPVLPLLDGCPRPRRARSAWRSGSRRVTGSSRS